MYTDYTYLLYAFFFIIIQYNIVRQFVNLFFKAYDPIRPTRLVKDIAEGKDFIKSCNKSFRTIRVVNFNI
mgnify:CR=1 FL=1